MHPVRFRLYGRVCLAGPDGERAVHRRMSRAMLAVLLLDAGRDVSSARIAGALWDHPPLSAESNLRTHKHALRQELARARLDDRLVHANRGAGYRIDAREDEVDTLVFRRLAAVGREQLNRSRPGVAAAYLRRALDASSQDAGEDLPKTRRLNALMHCLNDIRRVVAEDLGRAELMAHRATDAIPVLTRLVADHPIRERGWALLASAHYLAGNPAEAQAVVRRGYDALDAAVSLYPGVDLRGAERAAVSHDTGWFERYLLDQR